VGGPPFAPPDHDAPWPPAAYDLLALRFPRVVGSNPRGHGCRIPDRSSATGLLRSGRYRGRILQTVKVIHAQPAGRGGDRFGDLHPLRVVPSPRSTCRCIVGCYQADVHLRSTIQGVAAPKIIAIEDPKLDSTSSRAEVWLAATIPKAEWRVLWGSNATKRGQIGKTCYACQEQRNSLSHRQLRHICQNECL